MDIINETISSNPEDIKMAADYRDIPFSSKMKILPLLIGTQRFHNKMSMQDEKTMEYGLKNIAEEILANQGQSGKFFQLKNTELIGILFLGNIEDSSRERLEELCEKYIVTCNQYLHCDLCCYVGEIIYAHELASMVNELIKLKRNNVTISNKIFRINEKLIKASVVNKTDTSIWGLMLKNGTKDKLILEVKNYLEDLSITSELRMNALYGFQQDFNQMIFTVLAQQGMQAHEMFNDSKTVEMNANATRSLQEMLEWVEYIIERTIELTEDGEKQISPVIKAKNFIKLHLDKELTREEIASHVYLNPDYFDRVFKRETGLSVSRFIMQERLVKAQDLLLKTDLPISVIAINVGYPNSANFSSMFKRMTGMNPADYRKNKKES
jgi:two-component system response regulator YesN